MSQPALDKRPAIAGWIGRDLAPIAAGVLAEMLGNRELQRAIRAREISAVVATTRSVLRTGDIRRFSAFRTTITYFHHDGTLFSDAISVPASAKDPSGYRAVPMDSADGLVPMAGTRTG